MQKNEKEMKLTSEQLLRKYLPEEAVKVALTPASPAASSSSASAKKPSEMDPFGGGDVYIDGYLEIGDDRGRWHRRWVILRRGILLVFATDETKGDPELMVNLDSCHVKLIEGSQFASCSSAPLLSEGVLNDLETDDPSCASNSPQMSSSSSRGHGRSRSNTKQAIAKPLPPTEPAEGEELSDHGSLLQELMTKLADVTERKRAADLVVKGRASAQDKKLLDLDAESPDAFKQQQGQGQEHKDLASRSLPPLLPFPPMLPHPSHGGGLHASEGNPVVAAANHPGHRRGQSAGSNSQPASLTVSEEERPLTPRDPLPHSYSSEGPLEPLGEDSLVRSRSATSRDILAELGKDSSESRRERRKLRKIEEAKMKKAKKEEKEKAKAKKEVSASTPVGFVVGAGSEGAGAGGEGGHEFQSEPVLPKHDPKKEEKKMRSEQKKLEAARLKQQRKEEKTARSDEKKYALQVYKTLSQEKKELKKQIKMLELTVPEKPAATTTSSSSSSSSSSSRKRGITAGATEMGMPGDLTESTGPALLESGGKEDAKCSGKDAKKKRSEHTAEHTAEEVILEILHPGGASITLEMPLFGPDKDRKLEKRKEKEKEKAKAKKGTALGFGLLGRPCVALRAPSFAEGDRWMKEIAFFCVPPVTMNEYGPYSTRFLDPLKSCSIQFEQCQWFNMFLARYWKDIIHSEKTKEKVHAILAKKFSQIRRPSFLGPCVVEAVDMGKDVFTISRIRLLHTDVPDELIGEVDIIYTGGASLVVTTDVKYGSIAFGIYIFVKVMSLKGTLTFYGPPECASRFSMAFTQLPECNFDVKIQLGNKKKVQITDYAKVRNFIISVLEKLIWKNVVVPNKLTFGLPLPGNKLAAKTIRLASRRTREDRAMDFAAEIASMDRARQYLSSRERSERNTEADHYSYLYRNRNGTSTAGSAIMSGSDQTLKIHS
ncbi:MAG: hypothetical protein Q8P67_17485 [archaeon]|nr:hypothetical protein [archaeon]